MAQTLQRRPTPGIQFSSVKEKLKQWERVVSERKAEAKKLNYRTLPRPERSKAIQERINVLKKRPNSSETSRIRTERPQAQPEQDEKPISKLQSETVNKIEQILNRNVKAKNFAESQFAKSEPKITPKIQIPKVQPEVITPKPSSSETTIKRKPPTPPPKRPRPKPPPVPPKRNPQKLITKTPKAERPSDIFGFMDENDFHLSQDVISKLPPRVSELHKHLFVKRDDIDSQILVPGGRIYAFSPRGLGTPRRIELAPIVEDSHYAKYKHGNDRIGTFSPYDNLLPFPFDFSEKIFCEIIQSMIDHQYGVKMDKKGCMFYGQSVVDWLIHDWSANHPTIDLFKGKRVRAVAMCHMLLDIGFIESCDEKQEFSDDTRLFSFPANDFWKDLRKYIRRFNDMKALIQMVNSNRKLVNLLNQMVGGIEIKDRKYRRRIYKNCFIGRECVDWMTKRFRMNRKMAVKLGEMMRRAGAIEHVEKRKKSSLDSFVTHKEKRRGTFGDNDEFYSLQLNFLEGTFSNKILAAYLL